MDYLAGNVQLVIAIFAENLYIEGDNLDVLKLLQELFR